MVEALSRVLAARDGSTHEHSQRVHCYDPLTSDRPYRRALSHGCAVAMIHDGRSTLYDATIVDAFLGIVQRLRSGSAKEAGGRPQTRVSSRWLHARAV